MKKILMTVFSVVIVFFMFFSSSAVGFASVVYVNYIESLSSVLKDRMKYYTMSSSLGEKVAILCVIRDFCVDNGISPSDEVFSTFLHDMFNPGSDSYMSDRYGSNWKDFFEHLDFYFKKLAADYNMSADDVVNWIIAREGDNITNFDDESGTVQVPSDDLVEYIEEQNTLNTPKGKDLFIQSYRSENFFHLGKSHRYIPIFDDDKKTQFNDLYLIPSYTDANGDMYFSEYQYHLYYVPSDDSNSDIMLQFDLYKYTDGLGNVLDSSYSRAFFDFSDFQKPFCLGFGVGGCDFLSYYSLSDYSNKKEYTNRKPFRTGVSSGGSSGSIPQISYYSTSGEKYTGMTTSKPGTAEPRFYYSYETNYVEPNEDLGFVCSHSLIERTYKDIDTSKIPSNQVINITGDTIYDYSITNPDSGASTTINEYVTNNYYYPEVPSTSEPSGGGSGVGGNVNVTGNIGVGGQVGVDINVSVPDININVNQGSGVGGSDGTVPDPDDILNGSSVDLDKYYDDAVSQASGVRSFLAQFFDFLPAEIIGLLGMLIAVAIVCRIFGR